MRVSLFFPLILAACAGTPLATLNPFSKPAPAAAVAPPLAPPVPADSQVATPPPPPQARTVQQFDTTSREERAKALDVAPAPASERNLGTTVASLGAPTDPGIWIKTPLVKSVTQGRAEVKASGKTANIELRPLPGESGGGSQISLAAMRLLDIPLTDLPELVLFAK